MHGNGAGAVPLPATEKNLEQSLASPRHSVGRAPVTKVWRNDLLAPDRALPEKWPRDILAVNVSFGARSVFNRLFTAPAYGYVRVDLPRRIEGAHSEHLVIPDAARRAPGVLDRAVPLLSRTCGWRGVVRT